MKKFTLGVAAASAFTTLSLGMAAAAMATRGVAPRHDAVYSRHSPTTTVHPVDCSVHVNYQGSNVGVTWC
jgi:hypothetical protein